MRGSEEALSSAQLAGKRDEILRVATTHGAENVRIFGSVAKGTESPTSDVDILVTMRPGFGLMAMGRIKADLEDLLGCRVDVSTEQSLRSDIRQQVVQTARKL